MIKELAMQILTSYPQDKLKEELTSCGVREDNINTLLNYIYKGGNKNEYDDESRNGN